MLRLHQTERAQFKRLFDHEQHKNADEMLKLLEAFLSIEEHVSGEELHVQYRKAGGMLDRNFVAEAIEIMIKYGFAHRVTLDGQPVRYEHRHLGNHHDHLVCTRCGNVEEFFMPELELLQDRIANQYRFQNLQHRMEIYGLCNRCALKDAPTFPLSSSSVGDRVIIERIKGDKGVQFRLRAMGVKPGQKVEIISNNGGPVVIARGGTRLAIGRSLSAKIMVRRSG